MSEPHPHPRRTTVSFAGATTIDDVVDIADGAAPALDPAAIEAIAQLRAVSIELSASAPTYGRTTGVGANRLTQLADDAGAHGMRLLRSHAADAGAPLAPRIVRAMLAVRLAQLCVPGSGIDPAALEALATQLADDALPTIGEFGGIGTGDLTALAAAGLALAGERATSRPLRRTFAFDTASALPFISSNALTIGRACLAIDRARILDDAALGLAAIASIAFEGNPQAFSPLAARAMAAPGVETVCAHLRSLTAGAVERPARIQDPYGLRVFPAAHAARRTAIDRLAAQCGALLTAAQENPTFDAALGIAHHGGFFAVQLALDLDGGCLAIARAATTQLALLRMTADPALNGGLRPFLALGPAGASGLMMLEYTAASALAEARAAATPAAVATASLSRGAEEDAAFASQGAVQLERALRGEEIVLACTALAVARLAVQRGVKLPAPLAGAAPIVASLAGDDDDHELAPEIERARAALPELAAIARAAAPAASRRPPAAPS